MEQLSLDCPGAHVVARNSTSIQLCTMRMSLLCVISTSTKKERTDLSNRMKGIGMHLIKIFINKHSPKTIICRNIVTVFTLCSYFGLMWSFSRICYHWKVHSHRQREAAPGSLIFPGLLKMLLPGAPLFTYSSAVGVLKLLWHSAVLCHFKIAGQTALKSLF